MDENQKRSKSVEEVKENNPLKSTLYKGYVFAYPFYCFLNFVSIIQLEILIANKIKMRSFWEKMSVTKLVFLILTIVLSFQTIYLTLNGIETSLFNNAMLMVISFYFGQKVWEAKADPLIDWDKEDGRTI